MESTNVGSKHFFLLNLKELWHNHMKAYIVIICFCSICCYVVYMFLKQKSLWSIVRYHSIFNRGTLQYKNQIWIWRFWWQHIGLCFASSLDSNLLEKEIFLTTNMVQLHIVFHFHPFIGSAWLKYCWKGHIHMKYDGRFSVSFKKNTNFTKVRYSW